MSKAVLLSIRPQFCELILEGRKTVEIRKTCPKLAPPFTCYIYCTKATFEHDDFLCINAGSENARAFYGGGMVVGEFICDDIRWVGGSSLIVKEDREAATAGSCVSREDLFKYLGIVPGMSVYDKKCEFYCWHISDLKAYDKPKPLYAFRRSNTECIAHGTDGVPICEKRKPCQACSVVIAPQSWLYVEETNE